MQYLPPRFRPRPGTAIARSIGKPTMSTYPYIPFHVPSIGDEEVREVEATLRSGWLTTGPRTDQFEREFRSYVRAPYAIAVNS